MTNRLLGLFAASLFVVSACGGESDATSGADDALASEFQGAERRTSGDGGVGNGRGRGNCGDRAHGGKMGGAGHGK